MKKVILLVICTLVLSGAVNAAEAKATTSQKMFPVKEKIEKVRGNVATTTGTSTKDKLVRRTTGLYQKLTNLASQLEGLLERVKDRIVKMEDAGKDVADAKAKLPAAENAVAKAKTSMETASTDLAKLAASSTPKEAWKVGKETVKQVSLDFKEAHRKIVDVISALKPARIIKNATTTATTTD